MQGGSMKRSLIFSVFILVAAGALSTAAPASAVAPTGGKFHLVYLVAAVDLKSGAKVTVDPIFFTDGSEVKNFHDLCRSKPPLRPEQVAADKKFIEAYCARKTFTFDPKDYHTLNNHGQQIAIGSIEFRVIDTIPATNDPVMMGSSTVASYIPGTISPPKWLRGDDAPEYFFLMAKDKTILEKIVPVSHAAEAEVQALQRRADEFSKLAQWRTAGSPTHMKDVERRPLCMDVTSASLFRLENPLIADLDLDGKLDMFVNVYTVVKMDAEPDQPLIDCFTSYRIHGNGEAILFGNEQWQRTQRKEVSDSTGGSYQRYLQNGYAVNAALIVVNLPHGDRKCAYRLIYSREVYMWHPYGVALVSINCPSIRGLGKLKSVLGD
jgi:hypothetical protein